WTCIRTPNSTRSAIDISIDDRALTYHVPYPSIRNGSTIHGIPMGGNILCVLLTNTGGSDIHRSLRLHDCYSPNNLPICSIFVTATHYFPWTFVATGGV